MGRPAHRIFSFLQPGYKVLKRRKEGEQVRRVRTDLRSPSLRADFKGESKRSIIGDGGKDLKANLLVI